MIHTTPYIKQYDKNGVIANPITKKEPYVTHSLNRSKRREKDVKDKPGKMYIIGGAKFTTRLQVIVCKDGSKKRIVHFDSKQKNR